MVPKKIVFLDRDGVINDDHGYVSRIADFDFMPGVLSTCHWLYQMGYQLIVVTNQSGIARGMYSEADFLSLTEWMKGQFAQAGAPLLDVLYCPHLPEGNPPYNKVCICRKPKPGMLLRAGERYGIDFSQSIMVGDNESDMEAALAAEVAMRVLLSDSHPALPVASCATHHITHFSALQSLLMSKANQ